MYSLRFPSIFLLSFMLFALPVNVFFFWVDHLTKKIYFLRQVIHPKKEDIHRQSEQHEGQEEDGWEAQGIHEGAAVDAASICKSLGLPVQQPLPWQAEFKSLLCQFEDIVTDVLD